jgi:pyruvate dehydrogenase E1 component alpha subunit
VQVKEKRKTQANDLIQYYRQMRLIRLFEERSGELYMAGKIRGFLHLYIGEEAIAVGVAAALAPQDYIVTHYRDHGHALALGLDPRAVMAELYGKATGVSLGRGGSMHLFDASRNFAGGHAIVGGHLPMATGLALASKQLGEDRVIVAFFGDGAINEGEFHESMNLAAIWKLPVLFLLENNLYGMGSHIDRTFAGGREVYRAADHYRMPARRIDGMNVVEVKEAAAEALRQIRGGEGPFFLETVCYRFQGHSMADPVSYRERAEVEEWRPKDPITQLRARLLESGQAADETLQRLDKEVALTVEDAVQFAESSPDPDPESLLDHIYV